MSQFDLSRRAKEVGVNVVVELASCAFQLRLRKK
jgi:hypothetical protein